MTEKKGKAQDSRDACVRAIAEELKKDKWEVNANLEVGESLHRLGLLFRMFKPRKVVLTAFAKLLLRKCLKATRSGILSLRITATSMTSTCTW